MAFDVVGTILCLVALIVAFYYYSTTNYNFWKSRGIPGPKPIIFFGTIKDIFINKLSIGSYLTKIYNEYYDEPMVGIYGKNEPILVLRDIELIKSVMIKDFSTFSDRASGMDEKHEPLTANLFNLEPKRWRVLRNKLSPAYTSGKIREMFYLLNQCGEQLESYLTDLDGKSVDVRELAARFATDVIGICAFGIEANAMADEDSIFREMGKRIFHMNFKTTLRLRLQAFAPKIGDLLAYWLVDKELQDFFINLTRDTIEYRNRNNITRNDFLDQLKDLKNTNSKIDQFELTDSLLAAQLFLFYAAGFETSSTTISNCLLELAMNHDIHDRLREEIRDSLKKTNGEITYDSIQQMVYLDMVMKETLRKHPPVPALMRRSTTAYTFPDTKVSIPAGIKVWIPVYGIHRDAKYFPEPDVFDPERFTEEAVKNRHPMTFLSFGDGPRNCIGARFGSIQTKVGLIKILQNCTVDVCEKTDKNYKINERAFLLTPANGIYVKIIKSPIALM